jgi:hypothetical protein
MSRLGSWNPTTVEERLDRLESLAEIQQLPVRYALAVDSRDMDTMASLFVPDVQIGRDTFGRDALRAWFVDSLSRLSDTVHFVGNHIIDFESPDRARGIVYCHDEVVPLGEGTWNQGMLQYWDTYARVDTPEGREWCFQRRKYTRWYMADWLERPSHAADTMPPERRHHIQLPEAFETWTRFWDEVGIDPFADDGAPVSG